MVLHFAVNLRELLCKSPLRFLCLNHDKNELANFNNNHLSFAKHLTLLKTNFTVIEYPTSTPNYRLSGIAFRGGTQQYYELTVDSGSIIDHSQGKGKSSDLFERIILRCQCHLTSPCEDPENDDSLHCYKVHSHCWNWIKRLIGPLAEEHLDLLIAALRHRWKEFAYEIDELVDSAFEGHYHWVGIRLCSTSSPTVVL